MDELLNKRIKEAVIQGQDKETGLWENLETISESCFESTVEYRMDVKNNAMSYSLESDFGRYQQIVVIECEGFKDKDIDKMWKNTFGSWHTIWKNGQWL